MEKEELERFAEELKDESFVLVIFDGVGSVLKSVAMNKVVPEQILELGAEFDLLGKNGIMQASQQHMQRQHEEPKIFVPNPKIEVP